MGIIRECGGKMHMSEGKTSTYPRLAHVPDLCGTENWKGAQSDFFESFKNYDEAGSPQRIQVLKYLVLTTMLIGSDINPFDSPETKAYQNDPRVSAMTDLVDAYQRDDMHKYESILHHNQDVVVDPFIAEHIDEVTRTMRAKGVLKLVAPYTRFTLKFVAKQLKVSEVEVQDIVGTLILSGKLKAKINQTNATVEVERGVDAERLKALDQWSSAIDSLWSTVLHNSDGFRADDTQITGAPGGMSMDFIDTPPGRAMNSSSGRPGKNRGSGRKVPA